MDEASEPKPEVFVKNHNLRNFLASSLVILTVLTLAAVTLNYFQILTLSQAFPKLSFLPKKVAQPSSQNSGILNITPSQKFTLSCPVSEELCKTGKLSTYKGNPALIYNLPAGTNILYISQINKLEEVLDLENSIDKTKTRMVAAKDQDSCYIINYQFPLGSVLSKTKSFPILVGQTISQSSNSFIQTDEKANLIITLRKASLDADKSCVIWDNPQREAAPFQPLDEYILGF